MIKILLLISFIFIWNIPLQADEEIGIDQEFAQELDNIRNPFNDGFPPKPVIVPKPVYQPEVPKPIQITIPKPPPEVVTLPALNLQGVIIGGDIDEAIINDQVVPLQGVIEDAVVDNVSKKGVVMIYKGKKFFLKVE